MSKSLKIGKQYRSFTVLQGDINTDKRTVALSFSSEAPVERWFGNEILDHSPASVDLSRLKRGGALLIDHNPGNQVGVIEDVLIDPADRKGRAVVRFGRSAKAEEIFQDVVDGIRSNVSVGYQVHDMVLENTDLLSGETYRVTKWEPLEVSIVSIPADTSVGVGRSEENNKEIRVEMPEKTEGGAVMSDINISEVEERARQAERHRVAEITGIGDKTKCEDLAKQYVSEGKSLEEFREAVMERIYTKNPVAVDSADIGMSDKEVRQFSFLRAITAQINRDWKGAELERDASEAVAKQLKRSPQGFYVPNDVLKRDLTKGTASAGGYTVATDLLVSSFIELLRNRMMVRALGATILGGLVGDVAIPKQTGGATAYWVSESGAPTASQQTFGQITLTPKTVGAYTDMSRKLLTQSSLDVEAFVRQDLATILALAIDLAAINGTGLNNQPTGILATTGIGDVAGGTNGATPTWANIIALDTAIEQANAAVGNMAYLTNAKVEGKLKQVFTNATYGSIPIWTELPGDDTFDSLNGYRAAVSNQVPSNLTKGSANGVCSAIIFGNWADLIIGEWGALDVLVDPYTGGAAGTVRVRVLQDVDIAVRHAESFAAMKDALTA